MKSKKQNKCRNKINLQIQRTNRCQKGGIRWMGGNGERNEDVQIASYRDSHRDVNYSIGNVVSSIGINIYGIR